MFLFVLTSFLLAPPPLWSSSLINRSRRQVNGCGSMGLNIDGFLTEIGEHVLIVCCNEHDLCYDTCGKSQLLCDNAFLHCITQTCQQLLVSPKIDWCRFDGRILYWIVFFAGHHAYQQAQQQHQCSEQIQINTTTVSMVKQSIKSNDRI